MSIEIIMKSVTFSNIYSYKKLKHRSIYYVCGMDTKCYDLCSCINAILWCSI